MQITGIKTSLFKERADLLDFIKKHISTLDEGDILVVTSKIVALSESRVGKIEDKNILILKESKKVIKTPWAMLTLTSQGWSINAGIDESNADHAIILLPKNSFETAEMVRKNLKKYFSLKKFGVLITDTRSIPLRVGTIGRAIGYAGFEPLKSYIGKKDLFGRKSRLTKSNQADALAAGAVAVMGEGDERSPLAIIKNAPVVFISRSLSAKSNRLAFPPEQDIFSYVFLANKHARHKNSKKK